MNNGYIYILYLVLYLYVSTVYCMCFRCVYLLSFSIYVYRVSCILSPLFPPSFIRSRKMDRIRFLKTVGNMAIL